MKRFMLATTAVLALSAPAFAQSDAETVVSQELIARGYGANAIEMLTDEQITELYLVITSDDGSDVAAAIDGLNLSTDEEDSLLSDSGGDSDAFMRAEMALTEAGYPEGTVNVLADAQVTELYLAVSGESENDVAETIAGFNLDKQVPVDGPDSQAQMEVTAYLEANGYTEEEIASISAGEMTEIYLAISGGDETAINEAIDGAINS